MPRKAREKSTTGIYHIMLRGINRQEIFKDDEDYERLIQIIQEYKEVCEYKIFAYCIMNNHIHLLIKEGKEDFGRVFRRIGAKYVYWYNLKYKRVGHLFQDRYRSEVVENERYFLTVLRYIHQNPIKAGVINDIKKYPWSSYCEYFMENSICDREYTLSYFSDDGKIAMKLFKEFHIQENDDKCLENEERVRIDDMDAIRIVLEVSEVENSKQVQSINKERRDEIIKELRCKGLSIRQIERLTGISFATIRKVSHNI